MEQTLLTIVMWMLMILVRMITLYSAILTRITAAPITWMKLELESGTFPMELVWVLKCLKMNFTEIEEHKLYASIIDKAHSNSQKEDYSNVKCQMIITKCKAST